MDDRQTKPIPGFPGYEITEDGRIWSNLSDQWLSLYRARNGYIGVALQGEEKQHHKWVHRLVMETYRPIKNSDSMQVNHIDGIRDSNHLDNLEWCTAKENCWHRIMVLGHDTNGEKHPKAKLTNAQAKYAKEYPRKPGCIRKLADELGVSTAVIKYIRYGVQWKHV